MKTVAIAGVGLIGGSFGLALRKAGFSGEILGISSERAIEPALNAGAISRGSTLEEAAATADLIYLAQPVDRILVTLETLGAIAPSDCLITDAGSTKAAIVRKASECVRRGKLSRGPSHRWKGTARRASSRRRTFFAIGLTFSRPPPHRRALKKHFVCGCRVSAPASSIFRPPSMTPLLAFTSHLPQLVSIALANALANQKNENFYKLSGTGLLDMTRLALSSPELWQSIVCHQ